MSKTMILGLLVLGLCGCVEIREPMESKQASNPAYKVDFLFEYEGCRVYRFEDGGYHRYFTNCGGGTTSTSWTERVGKSDHPMENTTSYN